MFRNRHLSCVRTKGKNIPSILATNLSFVFSAVVLSCLFFPGFAQTSHGDVFFGEHQWPNFADEGVFEETETATVTSENPTPKISGQEKLDGFKPLSKLNSRVETGTSVCIAGINPSRGPEGTMVEIILSSTTNLTGPIFCRFGLETVTAEYHILAEEPITSHKIDEKSDSPISKTNFQIFCRASNLAGKDAVSLHVSADGIHFTASGPTFEFTEVKIGKRDHYALFDVENNPHYCVSLTFPPLSLYKENLSTETFNQHRELATLVDIFEGTTAEISGTGLGELEVGEVGYIRISLKLNGLTIVDLSTTVGTNSRVVLTGPLPSTQELSFQFEIFQNGSSVDKSSLIANFTVKEPGAYLVSTAIAALGGRVHIFSSPVPFIAKPASSTILNVLKNDNYTAGQEGSLEFSLLDSLNTSQGVNEQNSVWAFLSGPFPMATLQLPLSMSLGTTETGSYSLNFSSAFAGRYSGSIGAIKAGQSVYDSLNVTFNVSAGIPDPKFTTSLIPLPIAATVSSTVEYTFMVRDKFGNPISCLTAGNISAVVKKWDFSLSSSVVLTESISEKETTGECYLSFNTGISSGRVSIQVFLNSVEISLSPGIMEILPGEANPKRSSAIGPGTKGGVVGFESSFLVIVRDEFANQRKVGGDNVQVSILNASSTFEGKFPLSSKGVSVKVADNSDGTYLVTYNLTTTGEYFAYIAINGTLIGNGSPFSVTGITKSGPVSSHLIRRLQTVVPAGTVSWLEVIPVDSEGRAPVSDPSALFLLLSSQDSSNLQLLEMAPFNGVGWNATFNVSKTGVYELSCEVCPKPTLLLEDNSVLPTITVIPSTTSPTTSSLGTPSDPLFTGQIRFPFVARDIFGNTQVYRPSGFPFDSFAATATPISTCISDGGTLDSIIGNVGFGRVNNTSYDVEFLLTRAGRYTLSASLGGVPIGSQKQLIISPGAFDPSSSIVVGVNAQEIVAGKQRELKIYLFDSYRNPVTPTPVNSCLVIFTPVVFRPNGTSTVGQNITVGSCNASASCSPIFCQRLNGDCHLLANFNATVSGNFSLQIILNGEMVVKQPPLVEVVAGTPVATTSTVELLSSSVIAGNSPNVSLIARDRFNNTVEGVNSSALVYSSVGGRLLGGLPLSNLTSVSMENVVGSVNATGSVLMTPGSVTVQAFFGGVRIPKGLFNLTVLQSETSPSLSYAFGQGLKRSVGGTPSLFQVQTVTTQGRFQESSINGSSDGVEVVVSVAPRKTLDILGQVTKNTSIGGGAYEVEFMTYQDPKNSIYKVSVSLSVIGRKPVAVSNSPFYLSFLRGSVASALSNYEVPNNLSVTAGQILSINVVTKDESGNVEPFNLLADPISLIFSAEEQTNSSVNVTTVLQNFYNGSYAAIFQAEVPGAYNLFLKVGGDFLREGPLTVTVTSPSNDIPEIAEVPINILPDFFGNAVTSVAEIPKLSTTKSFANGSGVNSSILQVSTKTDFLITAVGTNGNGLTYGGAPWDILIYPTGNSNSSEFVARPVSVIDFDNGTYFVSYLPPGTGKFQVRIQLFGENIQGSPYNVTVTSGRTSPEKCIVFGDGLLSAIAGVPVTIYVQSVDENGVNRTGTSDIFEYQVLNQRGSVVSGLVTPSSSSGIYIASYTFVSAGPATVQILYQGKVFLSSNVEITPGIISSATSTVLGPSSLTVIAGSPCLIQAVALDNYGNQVNVTDVPFTAELYDVPVGEGFIIQTLVEGELTVESGEGAVYQIFLQPRVSGYYGIRLELNGEIISNGNVTLNVVPREPSASLTNVTGLGEGFVGVRGTELSFTVNLRDRYGNGVGNYGEFLQTGALVLAVGYISEDTGKGVEVVENFNVTSSSTTIGNYAVSVTPSVAGILQARLTIGGFLVFKSSTLQVPSIYIASGLLNGSRSTVFGPGITSAVMDKKSKVGLCLRDSEGFPLNTSASAKLKPVLTFSPGLPESLRYYNVTQATGCYYHITYVVKKGATSVAFPLTVTITSGLETLRLGSYIVNVKPATGKAISAVALNSNFEEIKNSLIGIPVQTGPTVFQIQGKDENSNAASLAVSDVVLEAGPFSGDSWGENGGLVKLTRNIEGEISVSVLAPKAGVYTVTYALSGDINGSSFSLIIPPGPAVKASLLYSGSLDTFAGAIGSVGIQIFDSKGQLRKFEPGNVSDPVFLELEIQNTTQGGSQIFRSILKLDTNGAYVGNYLTYTAGNYAFRLVLNGTTVSSSAISVKSGAFYGGTSSVDDFPLTVEAGKEISVNITAKDVYGNFYTRSDLIFNIFLTSSTGLSELVGVFRSSPANSYNGIISPTKTGNVVLTVVESSSGSEPLGSPFNLTIIPGSLSSKGTSLSVASGGVTNSPLYFVLVPRDDYYNPVNATIGTNFTATVKNLSSNETLSVEISDIESIKSSLTAPRCPDNGLVLVSYPLNEGIYTVSVTVNGIKVDGSPSNVSVVRQRAPVIETASLDLTQRAVIVTFTSETDRGGAPELDLTPCGSIFSKETVTLLGTSPRCLWKSPSTLTILLGFQSKLVPFTKITSFDAANATLSVQNFLFTKGSSSYSSVSSIAMGPARTELVSGRFTKFPRTTLGALWGNRRIIGICDAVFLDASGSISASGNLGKYIFRVLANQSSSALDLILSNHNSTSPKLAIPQGVLVPGITYQFVVFASDTQELDVGHALFTMVQSPDPVPGVSILVPGGKSEPREVFTKRGETLTLNSQTKFPNISCLSTDYSVGTAVKFLWSQISGPTLNFSASTLLNLSSTTSSLTIPSMTLITGEVYTLSLSVTMESNASLTVSDSVVLVVQPSDLNVFIRGGNRAVSANSDLLLEANAFDPDDGETESVELNPFQYIWSCTPVNESLSGCFLNQESVLSKNEANVIIPKYSLASGFYVFTVSVSRNPTVSRGDIVPGRVNKISSVTIQVLDKTVPEVSVERSDPLSVYGKLDYSEMLQLSCKTSNILYSYSWVYEGLNEDVDLNVTNQPLPISASSLNTSKPYSYRCDIFDFSSESPISSASLSIPGNEGPWGGSISVEQTPNDFSGYQYTISALDWASQDEDRPLKYSVSYMLNSSSETIPLSAPSSFYQQTVYLPPGNVTISATVLNNKGQKTVVKYGKVLTIPSKTSQSSKAFSMAVSRSFTSSEWISVIQSALESGDFSTVLQASEIYIQLFGSESEPELLEIFEGILLLWDGVTPTDTNVEQVSCLLNQITEILPPGDFTEAHLTGILGILKDSSSLFSGSGVTIRLSRRAAQCLISIASSILEVANQTSTSESVRTTAFSTILLLPGEIAEGFLQGEVQETESVTFTSTQVDLTTAIVRRGRKTGPDFEASAGSASCALNCTDSGVPSGGDLTAFIYAFKYISPLPNDPRLQGGVAVVGTFRRGVPVTSDVDISLGTNTTVNGSLSVRMWTGSTWISRGIVTQTSPISDPQTVIANDPALKGSQTFAPYLEKISLPTLTLPDIPPVPKKSKSGPSTLALILSIVLPPLLLLGLTLLGLEANRRRHPPSPAPSTSSGSYSPDKGI